MPSTAQRRTCDQHNKRVDASVRRTVGRVAALVVDLLYPQQIEVMEFRLYRQSSFRPSIVVLHVTSLKNAQGLSPINRRVTCGCDQVGEASRSYNCTGLGNVPLETQIQRDSYSEDAYMLAGNYSI